MQPSLLELARQGDPQAIAALMNQTLHARGVTVRATRRGDCLHLLLQSQGVLVSARLVPALQKAMQDLGSPAISVVKVYGRQVGTPHSLWTEAFVVKTTTPSAPPLSRSPDLPPDPSLSWPYPPSVATTPTPENSRFAPQVTSAAAVAEASQEQPIYTNRDLANPPPAAAGESPLTAEMPVATRVERRSRKPGVNLRWFKRLWPIVGGLVILGASIWFWWVWNQQERELREVAAFVGNLRSAEQAADLPELQRTQRQLQQAIARLEAMPSFLGLRSTQGNQTISGVQAQLTSVNNRLKREEQAVANLKLAQQLGVTAAQLIQQTPSSPSRQKASQNLRTAVTLLETIPPTAFVAEQAQRSLTTYRREYTAVSGQVLPVSLPTSTSASASPSQGNPQAANQAGKTVAQAALIEVELAFTDVSWLQVTSDGKFQYEGEPTKGEKKSWTAQKDMILRVGNAGSILLSVNGATPKPLGEPGAVLEIRITPQTVRSRPLLN